MVYIIGDKERRRKYDPLKLPKAIDFHALSNNIDLPREVKTKIQIAFSKMDKKKLKDTIDYLGDMRYTAANHENYKMAAYCKSVKELAENYLKSVQEQKLV